MHLRPDEVRFEARWPQGCVPALELVQGALSQLAEWGNLSAQPDTGRVASIEDFYRARFLYRLSEPGEAVEAGMAAFAQALGRRAELQSVALEDILSRLVTLLALSEHDPLDAVKVHEALRDLIAVFGSLADNAQAFMAAVARTIDLQAAEASALMSYKKRLIDYLERFIGDLVVRSSLIAQHLTDLAAPSEALLAAAAAREARDAAPGDDDTEAAVLAEKLAAWRERWAGLNLWFRRQGHAPSQAELLRARARSAIPQLLAALSELNDRRSGKSDRSADFRVLARWFAQCQSNQEAHRLFRGAFALSPARHLALCAAGDRVSASTPWADAPCITIHPKLRERGSVAPRGAPPRVQDRSRERALLGTQLAGRCPATSHWRPKPGAPRDHSAPRPQGASTDRAHTPKARTESAAAHRSVGGLSCTLLDKGLFVARHASERTAVDQKAADVHEVAPLVRLIERKPKARARELRIGRHPHQLIAQTLERDLCFRALQHARSPARRR